MSLANILADFQTDVEQCDSLIANAHGTDGSGTSILPIRDRKQITVAAFLNMFVAWETFLESSLAELMVGGATLSGTVPVRYVAPVSVEAARALVIGVQRYFDYGNHENVKRLVRMYFRDGYPYEPCLSAVSSDLADLRTMRNASAHITSTTQTALARIIHEARNKLIAPGRRPWRWLFYRAGPTASGAEHGILCVKTTSSGSKRARSRASPSALLRPVPLRC